MARLTLLCLFVFLILQHQIYLGHLAPVAQGPEGSSPGGVDLKSILFHAQEGNNITEERPKPETMLSPELLARLSANGTTTFDLHDILNNSAEADKGEYLGSLESFLNGRANSSNVAVAAV